LDRGGVQEGVGIVLLALSSGRQTFVDRRQPALGVPRRFRANIGGLLRSVSRGGTSSEDSMLPSLRQGRHVQLTG
jgi:hypothetical protein